MFNALSLTPKIARATAKIKRIGRDSGISKKGIYLIVIKNKIAEWVQI
jgi:hypothetical protein